MPSHPISRFLAPTALAVAACALLPISKPGLVSAAPPVIEPGSLTTPKGICPLKHTDVKARIAGPLARVTVTQQFENPFREKIEAVYAFPLPADAAVDDMTMRVGERTIRGLIKDRDEARRIYDDAKRAGHVASLLDQERPNIFTQSVANIEPGAKIAIEISYVQTMPYEGGSYEFNFPMVVGPRYIPGSPTGKQGGGWAPDTDHVPDASRITPQVTPEGTRAGHDISIDVAIDAGVPIASLNAKTHEVEIERPAPANALVRLRDRAVIPNKDFTLKYSVAGQGVQDAVLTHRGSKGGFFTLLLQPPERLDLREITPKELVFVLDTSGSMSGAPITKAKEAMQAALDQLNARDTFNLITFSGDTRILFPRPEPATPENRAAARAFLQASYGSGGTEMMKAIRAALAPSGERNAVRVVCFMTDGLVGNDYEIISEVQQHPEARVFAFGIGSSTNHFLLDSIAKYGRGEVEYVGLNDDGSAAARRFAERVRNPLLTDVSIDWGGLPVSETLPSRIPDLFAAKPVAISGRYSGPAKGVIRLRGRMAGREFTREIRVNLPGLEASNDVLATLWARRMVDDLMARDMRAFQSGQVPADLKQQITNLGLEFRLMTPFTSFVAVEEKTITEGGQPVRVEVPVEMPEGVSYDGVFGSEKRLERVAAFAAPLNMMLGSGSGGGVGSGRAAGVGPGMVGGVAGGVANQIMVTAEAAVLSQDSAKPPAKLDPAVAALIERVRNGGRPSVNESKFVFGGQARVRLTLSDTSQAALEQLRNAGFIIERREGAAVIGQAPVTALEALSKLTFVTWIAPRVG